MSKWNFKKDKASRPSVTARRFGELNYNGNTFETTATPGEQANRTPSAIPYKGKTNPLRAVKYEGEPNIADETASQLITDKRGTSWKNIDVAMLPIEFNYMGLAMRTELKETTEDGVTYVEPKKVDYSETHNDYYNKQFVDNCHQALSAVFATQLTDLKFPLCKYKTSIPQMSEKGTEGAMIGLLVFMQTIMQNVAGVFGKQNTLYPMMNYLVKMGYLNEAPFTVELFNLMKKATFTGNFDILASLVKESFFDTEWYNNTTVLNAVPSKLTNDLQSCLETIVGSHVVPDVAIYDTDGSLLASSFESDNTTTQSDFFLALKQIKVTVGEETEIYDFQTLCHMIMLYLDPYEILAWARQTKAGVSTWNSKKYFNKVEACVKALIASVTTINNYLVDAVSYLLVLQDRAALNNWTFGTPFLKAGRPSKDDFEPVGYLSVHDIIKAYGVSGPLKLDENTMRWKIYSLWHESLGIPDYDYIEGGFPVAASIRKIPANATNDYTHDLYYMVPVMFDRFHKCVITGSGESYKRKYQTRYQQLLNRLGSAFSITVEELDATQIKNNSVLARLNLLGKSDVKMRVPVVNLTSEAIVNDNEYRSRIDQALVKMFGVCKTIYGSGDAAVSNYRLDTAIVGLAGREYRDYSTAALNYLNSNVPFRSTAESSSIGFFLISGGSAAAPDPTDE